MGIYSRFITLMHIHVISKPHQIQNVKAIKLALPYIPAYKSTT